MISLIHPSRGRAKKSWQAFDKWMTMAKHSCEWLLCLDNNDNTIGEYLELRDASARIFSFNSTTAIEAINYGAKEARGNIFMVVSDDTDCYMNWDEDIYKYVDGNRDWILKTKDGVQPWIITNPIMDRFYYNRFGYIYHPEYKHMFCDTELTCVADLTGRKITSNILFKHNHYSVTKEPPDAISKRADGTWDQGEKLFLERYKRNFDLPPDQIKGKIEDNGMIRWLQRKAR